MTPRRRLISLLIGGAASACLVLTLAQQPWKSDTQKACEAIGRDYNATEKLVGRIPPSGLVDDELKDGIVDGHSRLVRDARTLSVNENIASPVRSVLSDLGKTGTYSTVATTQPFDGHLLSEASGEVLEMSQQCFSLGYEVVMHDTPVEY